MNNYWAETLCFDLTMKCLSQAQVKCSVSSWCLYLEGLEMLRSRASEIKGGHGSEDFDCKLQHCDPKSPPTNTGAGGAHDRYHWAIGDTWGWAVYRAQSCRGAHSHHKWDNCGPALVQPHRGDQSTNGQTEPVAEADPHGRLRLPPLFLAIYPLLHDPSQYLTISWLPGVIPRLL
jgi:hypothetical protein